MAWLVEGSTGERQTALEAQPVEELGVATDDGPVVVGPRRRIVVGIVQHEVIEKERIVGRHGAPFRRDVMGSP